MKLHNFVLKDNYNIIVLILIIFLEYKAGREKRRARGGGVDQGKEVYAPTETRFS